MVRTYRPPAAGDAAVKFRVDWDDAPLYNALNRMGYQGPTLLRDIMHIILKDIVIPKTKKAAEIKAGAGKGKYVPAGGGWSQSKNIYIRLAESLEVIDEPGNTFLRAGSMPYPGGVVGQRGGKLAQIVAGGMKAFPYSHVLPSRVRSSVKHFAKSGKGTDLSIPMKRKRLHPGFKKWGFVTFMEGTFEREYEKQAPEWIRDFALASGFELSEGSLGGFGWLLQRVLSFGLHDCWQTTPLLLREPTMMFGRYHPVPKGQ